MLSPSARPENATLLIPGQGAQKVGMGLSLYRAGGVARLRFEAADDALGFKLSELMFEGPSELLRHTEHLQPALVALAVAEADRLAELGLQPRAAIGHSVGQFAALVIAQSLAFEDALRLVRHRGRLMQATVPVGDGAMALVVGIPRATVATFCTAVDRSSGVVEVACHNAPEQTVIAGTRAAVDIALDACEDAGAAIVDLAVSVPFHCSLLAPVTAPFAELLSNVTLHPPRITVYDNVDAKPLTDAASVRRALIDQITAPVRFEEGLRASLAAGCDAFVQCGPGRGLAPLVKALSTSTPFHYLEDFEPKPPRHAH